MGTGENTCAGGGAEPAPTSIREFDAFVKAENATWKPIAAAGLQVQ